MLYLLLFFTLALSVINNSVLAFGYSNTTTIHSDLGNNFNNSYCSSGGVFLTQSDACTMAIVSTRLRKARSLEDNQDTRNAARQAKLPEGFLAYYYSGPRKWAIKHIESGECFATKAEAKAYATGQSHGVWDLEETSQLLEAISRFSLSNWNEVENHVDGRTAEQCRDRWFNVLQDKTDDELKAIYPQWQGVEDGPEWTSDLNDKLFELFLTYGDRYFDEIATDLSASTGLPFTGHQVRRQIDILGFNSREIYGCVTDLSAVQRLIDKTVDQCKDQYAEEIAREKVLVGDSFNATKFVREKLWGKDDDGTGLIGKTPIQLWEQFNSTKKPDMHIAYFLVGLLQIEHKAPKFAFPTNPDHPDYRKLQKMCWSSDNLTLEFHDYNNTKGTNLLGNDTHGEYAELIKDRVAEKETKLNAKRKVAIIENRMMESPMLTLLLNDRSTIDIAGLTKLMTYASKKVCLVNDWEFNGNESDDDHGDDDVEMKTRKYAGSRKSEGTAASNFQSKGDDNEELNNQIEELHGIIEELESSGNGEVSHDALISRLSDSLQEITSLENQLQEVEGNDVGRGVLINRLKDALQEIESLKMDVVYFHANNLEQARTIDSLSEQVDEYYERVESMAGENAVISEVASVQINELQRKCGVLEQEIHALEDAATDNVAALCSERDRLQMEVHAKTSVIKELSKHKDDSKELDELKKEVAELTNQMERLNSQLKLQESMHNDEIRKMTLDYDMLSNTQECTENELRELKALHEGNLARLRVEEELTETNRNELRRNKKKIEDQKSTISSLEDQHTNLMESKIKDGDEAEKTIHELRVKCLMLESERDKLLKSKADYETQVTTLEAKVLSRQNEAQRQLQSIQDERNEAQRQLKSSLDENHEVQRQLQSIQDEKAAVEQQLKSCQDNNEAQQRQLDTAKSSQSEMQLQLESSQAAEAQAQQELETSQAKNIKSQQQLEASRSELQRQLDLSRDETNKLQSLLETSESERGELSNEVDKLTSERGQLEVNFKQQLNSCREEKAVLQEQFDTSKLENKHSQQQLESSQDEVKDLQLRLDQLEIKSSQKLEISRQEKESLQRQLDTAKTSQSEMKKQLDSCQVENDKLQDQLKSSQAENIKSQQQLQARIRELEQKFATSQKENETMQAKFEKESTNQQIEIKNKELQVKNGELETKNAKLQECLTYEKKLCKFVIEQKGELKSVNQDLESTIETNESKLAAVETELKTKETVLKSMTTEATSLQKDHISSNLLETDLNKINENNRIEAQRITLPKGEFALLELRRKCKRRRDYDNESERRIDVNEIDLDDDDL